MNGTNEANYSNGSAIVSINRFRKPPLIDRTPLETCLSRLSLSSILSSRSFSAYFGTRLENK